MNQTPLVVGYAIPTSLHPLLGLVEAAAIVGVTLVAVRISDADGGLFWAGDTERTAAT